MIREIIKPAGNTYLLKLPDEMVGKTVEVFACEVEENKITQEVKKSVGQLMIEMEGLTTDLSNFKFSREEANDYD